jgi:hypothetical protein
VDSLVEDSHSTTMEVFCEEQGRLPDFIIAGAMKSGTTSLHHLLNQHERVFIPGGEIHFFDIDDIGQHPDFFVHRQGNWTFFDYERQLDRYLGWYRAFFRPAGSSQSIGEDSTTYLASEKAPARIAALLPDVKLIFMLRDPVSRTYSQYWHFVRTKRVFFDFEDAIRYTPDSLLERSLYKKQIERYRRHFPAAQIKYVLFEEFVKDPQRTVDDICCFLGLAGSVDVSKAGTQKNMAQLPRNVRLQLLYNRLFRRVTDYRYFDAHLPGEARTVQMNRVLRLTDKVFRRINPVRARRYPPMKPETRAFLQKFFAKENRGLSELIGIDVLRYWPYME